LGTEDVPFFYKIDNLFSLFKIDINITTISHFKMPTLPFIENPLAYKGRFPEEFHFKCFDIECEEILTKKGEGRRVWCKCNTMNVLVRHTNHISHFKMPTLPFIENPLAYKGRFPKEFHFKCFECGDIITREMKDNSRVFCDCYYVNSLVRHRTKPRPV